MTYDADFKRIFEEIASDSHTTVLKSVEVGVLPLEIDLVLELDKDSQLQYLAPIQQIRERVEAKRFIIEYKGPTDRAKVNNLRKLLAYRQLFLIEHDGNEEQKTVPVVLSSTHPRKLLKTFHAKNHSEGVYSLIIDNQEIYVISINSLPVREENFGLLIFATKKKKITKLVEILFDESMIGEENRQILHEEAVEERFLRYAVKWNYEIVADTARQRGIKMSIVKENLKKGIEDIGIAEMIEELGLPKVIDEVGLSKVIAEIGLPKVIEEVGPTKVIAEIGLPKVAEVLTEEQKKELKALL